MKCAFMTCDALPKYPMLVEDATAHQRMVTVCEEHAKAMRERGQTILVQYFPVGVSSGG